MGRPSEKLSISNVFREVEAGAGGFVGEAGGLADIRANRIGECRG
jgi:hypothetical protein